MLREHTARYKIIHRWSFNIHWICSSFFFELYCNNKKSRNNFSSISGCYMIGESFLLMLTLSFCSNFYLFVHNSMRNLSYLGICLTTLKSITFTLTFFKIYKIFPSKCAWTLFLVFMALWGNKSGMNGLLSSSNEFAWVVLLGVIGNMPNNSPYYLH